MTKPNPERIERAREMLASGKFRRKVISRSAKDLHFDSLKLECGHESGLMAGMKEVVNIDCHKCAEEWLKGEEPREG